MKTCTLALTAFAAGSALARQGAWQQCGGGSYTGSKRCVSGYKCHVYNEYYHQCIPNDKATSQVEAQPTTMVTSQSSAQDAPPSSAAVVYPASTTPAYIQGPHTASAPAASSPASSAPASSSPASSAAASSAASAPAASSSSSSGSGSGGSGGGVSYAGVNIAGFDFGCGTDGTCDLSSTTDPGQNGIDQMNHFVSDDGLNVFRLPVAWQYLVNNQLGGTLDADNFATYNKLVQGCLDAGAALCIIDIHNYARWNGQIIGQGGPTNAQYASLWSQLATKYASNSKIAFGLMNEPHDLTISDWADSVQAAVTAIRKAGATSNKCLLPGTDYTSAAQFIDNGSGAALSKVTNLDGSTDNLVFDVHKYLDSDNSGTSATCTTNNVDAFTALGQWLQSNGRQAMLTETGGGASDDTCLTKLCEELATLNKFSDVFLGWVGWSAGAFDTSYVLTETPEGSKGSFTDQPLVKQCIVGQFKG